MNRKNWWKKLFDKDYLENLGDLTYEQTSMEVDFVAKASDLSFNDSILDLACGHGRHSILLAKKGFRLTGLDYSTVFLEKARRDARKEKVKIKFLWGDMRKLKANQKFDVVLCLFSSFGYFDDRENLETLQRIAGVLNSKGRLLLDVINPHFLFSIFKKNGGKIGSRYVYKLERTEQIGVFEVKITQLLDLRTQIEHNHKEWSGKGRKRSTDYYLRHYTLEEYKKMLREADLKFKRVWGGYTGEEYTTDSRRLIILAQKNP